MNASGRASDFRQFFCPAFGITILLLLVVLCGCKHADEAAKVTDYMHDLREAFNKGNCEAIYTEADPAFRTQSAESWDRQCAELRHNLGSWNSFRESQSHEKSSDPRLRLVIGEAVFANGSYHLEAVWNVTGPRSRLCYMQIGTEPDLITVPPMKWRNPRDVPRLPLPSG